MSIKGFIQSFEVKEIDEKSGFFKQAYTRYNVLDSDKDYGRKGMFTKTWRENFSRIRHLLNHDSNRPIGEPKKFYDEGDLAVMESQLGSNNDAEDFKKMVLSGLIKEASYGYQVIKSNKLKDGSQELLEVKLWEVSSLTGWGANEYTPILAFQKGLNKSKSEILLELTETYHLMKSFTRNSNATDRTIQDLEIEQEKIKSAIDELLQSTEPEQATQPQMVDEIDTDLVLSFYQLNSN